MTRNRPHRVVYIVSLFPCWSETFIVREIRTLIAAGVDVRIISLKRPSESLVQADAEALLPRVRHPGFAFTGVSGLLAALLHAPIATLQCITTMIFALWRSPAVLGKSMIALMRGLQHLRWLHEFAPQHIHAHWATYPSTVAWALSRIGGFRFGFTCHAHDIFVDRQLLARKIEDAALAVTISQYNVRWLSERETPLARERMHVIHCGVERHAAGADDATQRKRGLILAVGRLDPIKGFATLIEALAILDRRTVDFHCVVVGEGPLRAALQARIDALGLATRVELVGARAQEAVQGLMREASVFALPCEVAADGNRDGIPVALMEAMALGCPVLSTPVSGVPELVRHDDTGLLVEAGNATALADALQRLFGDPGLCARLVEAAKLHVRREFDAATEAGKLLALMQTQEAVHGG